MTFYLTCSTTKPDLVGSIELRRSDQSRIRESAAKVDKVDEDDFRNDILPFIDGPGVEFVGDARSRAASAHGSFWPIATDIALEPNVGLRGTADIVRSGHPANR